jgi:hypothetical protein
VRLDHSYERVHLGNLGSAYVVLGESRRAIEYHQQYLVIARVVGDRQGKRTDLWNMALILDKLGQRTPVVECAEAALQILE